MQSRNNIYIRVDGNGEIGLGHLVRCIALAKMLAEDFDIRFVCKFVPEQIKIEICESGFSVYNEETFFKLLISKDLVVLDNYYYDISYQKKIKEKGCKLICIDDLHHHKFIADVIINHSPAANASDYNSQSYTQYALGTEYVLLRPEFLNQTRDKNRIKKDNVIVICFGGADPLNLTEKALKIVIDDERFSKINVITGAAFTQKGAVQKIVDSDSKRITWYHSISALQVSQIMNASRFAIVPSSGVLLEALSCGCITISGAYTENQKDIFQVYKDSGYIVSAKDFSNNHIIEAINNAFASYPITNQFDGKSGKRLLRVFEQLIVEDSIILRGADASDTMKTYEWATSSIIRQFSFNKSTIKKSEHELWFKNKLSDMNCEYFIASKNKRRIGSIRFDIKEGEAVISYLIDPKWHKRGFGIIILKKGYEYLKTVRKDVDVVVGYVVKENVASAKAFIKLGYIKEIENNESVKFVKKMY